MGFTSQMWLRFGYALPTAYLFSHGLGRRFSHRGGGIGMAERLDTAGWYRRFALVEARCYSPTQDQWYLGISDNPQLLLKG
ncbi:hypothetical protein GCM10009582_22440 [Arthrobacter flavus]